MYRSRRKTRAVLLTILSSESQNALRTFLYRRQLLAIRTVEDQIQHCYPNCSKDQLVSKEKVLRRARERKNAYCKCDSENRYETRSTVIDENQTYDTVQRRNHVHPQVLFIALQPK